MNKAFLSHSVPATLRREDLESRPLAEALTLPAYMYADPAFHAFDAQAIFARSWQLVGRAGEVATAGDHLVAEIAGKPVLVVRGDDGALRGFFNVCKHRAGPLALRNGNARLLHCKYHGWTYTLEGQLRAAPEMQDAAGLDMNCIRLDPLRVAEWEGLVFAAVDDPGVALEALLAGIGERIRPTDLRRMQFQTRVVYDVACNWKAYIDNYQEGYHLPHVHPGLKKILDYRTYTTELAEWHSWQHSPLDGGNGPYADGQAYYFFIYPNMMLNILPDRVQTNIVVPVAHDRCQVVFDYYYAETDPARLKKLMEDDLHFSDEVQKEDMMICERVQKGLTSGAYQAGRLSPKRESGVKHFQDLLRRAYSQALGS